MVVRIPGPDEPALFGPPIAVPDASPFPDAPQGTKDAMTRLAAQDDAVFIASSLAELTVRQRAAALAAEDAAHQAAGDPGTEVQQIDGFARRLDADYAADVERLVGERQALTGPKPSDAAFDLFRRRAEGVRRGLLARNAVTEDNLRRAAQLRRLEGGLDGLTTAVAAEPDGLGEALARLGDIAGAAESLVGPEQAAALAREYGLGLATAAARGLIAQDADAGLEAVRSGAFDDHLDETARSRLLREAESLSRANLLDGELGQRRQATAETRAQEARALAFEDGFRRRLAADEAGYAEIAAAQADGTLTPARALALKGALEQQEAARAEEQEKIGRTAAILRDGGRLDPRDPGQRDLAEIFFDRLIGPQLDGLPPGDRIGFLEQLPERIGVMPDGAICPLGGMVLAGAPADRVAAARALRAVIQRDPESRHCLPPPVVPFAEALDGLDPLRLPPETAIALAANSTGFRNAFQGPYDPPARLEHSFATGENEGAKPIPLFASNGAAPSDALPFGERDLGQLAELRSSLEKDGEFDQASLLGKILDMLRRGLRRPPQAPRPSRPRQKEPDDRESGPTLPRPKVPVPPIPKSDSEKPDDRPAPGPGHNGPPADGEREDRPSGVQDVEIGPGITMRGDPSSDIWSRFTGALDRLTGKSREAADELVNGGELTTSERAGERTSNVTRRGTLEDSLREFDKAVERAGGTVDDIAITPEENGTRRYYKAGDGTEFQHRDYSADDPGESLERVMRVPG